VNCSGFTESLTLSLQPTCSENSTALDCALFKLALQKREVIDRFSLSASWCPVQQKTILHSNSFIILDESGSTVPTGGIISQSRSISAVINITIECQVLGTSVSSTNISSLVLTDGISSPLVPFVEYSQTFGNFVPNSYFLVYFNHTIDPSQFPSLNFNTSLSYVALIDVIFAPEGKKRRIENRQITFSSSVESDSTSFKIDVLGSPPSPSSSPSSSPSVGPTASSDRNGPSALALGVGVGVGGSVFIVFTILIVFLVFKLKKKNKNSPYGEHKAKHENDVEMFDKSPTNNI